MMRGEKKKERRKKREINEKKKKNEKEGREGCLHGEKMREMKKKKGE